VEKLRRLTSGHRWSPLCETQSTPYSTSPAPAARGGRCPTTSRPGRRCTGTSAAGRGTARCCPVFPFGIGMKAANRRLPTAASKFVISAPRFLQFTLNHYKPARSYPRAYAPLFPVFLRVFHGN